MKACAILVGAALLAAASATAEVPAAAQQQFEAGQYAEAAKTLEAVLKQSPNDAAVHFWLARTYFELRNFAGAVTHAERATELAPDNSEYHQWLGRSYGRRAERERSFGMARRTRQAFEEAVRLDPRNISARRDLLDFYASAPWIVGGGKGKAREQAEAIARLDPVAGHLAMAAYWESENQYDQALAEYQQMLAKKPAPPEPYFEMADFAIRWRDPGRVQQALRAAQQVSPREPRLDYYRAVARVIAGVALDEAEPMLKDYLAAVPDRSDRPSHAAAREWLGRLYEQQGKPDRAAEQYRAALESQPTRRSAREALERLGFRP